jgi:hypothetical protein
MHATEKKAADIAMSEVENCVNALQTLESTWPGASKCKELLIELAKQAKEALTKIGKPKPAGHSSRNSVQLPSPTGSNRDRQDTSPKPQDNWGKVSQGVNGGQQRLNNVYALLNSPTRSTPSLPVNYMSPINQDAPTGLPLTIHDSSTAIKSSQPASPVFGPEMQDRQFAPFIPQNAYATPNWRLPSPPALTYLSDPRFFSQSQDFSASQGRAASNGPVYGGQPATPATWGNSDAQMPSFESVDLPPFSGMDFMQSFVPPGQMQSERLWDNMPEVFNAEPRMFGYMDDFQDGQM